MTTTEKRPTKISFPFGLYLRQLFSADTYVRFINPFSFWRRYRINHLETCGELDTVEYLERCHQIKWRPSKLFNCRESKNLREISALSCFPFNQADPNTIFIFQPSMKLKYRGVTYHTKEIFGININNTKNEPDLVEPNSLEQPLNSNNTNTSEISGSN